MSTERRVRRCRRSVLVVLGITSCAVLGAGEVIISEVHYHPAGDDPSGNDTARHHATPGGRGACDE